jgi:2-oxoglutarate ferredoxin oxidoreductase subunit beta
MVAVCEGAVYIERCALTSFKQIRRAKRAIKKAFQTQLDRLGFSMVELLSPCPTNWKLSPKDAWAWVNEVMMKTYPVGVIKDTTGYEDKK